jgi:pimeloyl-ACP methyl ester carboxylesterase
MPVADERRRCRVSHQLPLPIEVPVSFLDAITLPRQRSQTRSAKIPRKAKHLLGRLKDYTQLRIAFISLFLRRGLGLVQPRTLNPALLTHGLTLVLPGIESESVFTYGMCDGLADGGVPGQIRVFNWGLPFPGGYLANLTRIDRNRRRAKDIADEIIRYQDQFPGRPVHLVAQSGGAGIAIFAAESLPEGRQVDGIVLLGGALSPSYNLARAMRKSRKGVLNSHSCRDSLVLRWGTTIFGTTDRVFTAACGCVGFEIPSDLSDEDRRIYDEKLHQLAWCEDMADECQHWGGHLSSGGESFLAQKIAPWIKR